MDLKIPETAFLDLENFKKALEIQFIELFPAIY